MQIILIILLLLWLSTMASGVLAVVFVFRSPPTRPKIILLLSCVAIVIGLMGSTTWVPLFPQASWQQSNGFSSQSLRSSWFFVAPVVLGAVALIAAIWKRRPKD